MSFINDSVLVFVCYHVYTIMYFEKKNKN
uniref:Uncharacterized protein n=1 Tax=Anguilla anguilla TaxID=7936 RepID=A0A0E9PWE7_ANGAN